MDNKNLCSIYCFSNNINQKKYIGSTINDVNKRYAQHLYNCTHEKCHQYNYPLYQAIRKYGIENFTFKVLYSEICDEETIRKIEQEYILKYNSLSPNGYNQTLETQHPLQDSESYKKMSITKREKAKQVAEVDNDNKILHIFRSIIDCAEATGCDEKKIASCCRGERLSTNRRKFYWLDENNEIIIPIYKRDLYKGVEGSTQIQTTSKTVAKIDLETKEIIEIYPTIALAARENNCDASAISKVCQGKRKKCNNFNWQYVEKKELNIDDK